MQFLKNFGQFWYGFIVGDDWTIALGVVLAMAVTWVLTTQLGVNAWWLLLAGVFAPLVLSLFRATERH